MHFIASLTTDCSKELLSNALRLAVVGKLQFLSIKLICFISKKIWRCENYATHISVVVHKLLFIYTYQANLLLIHQIIQPKFENARALCYFDFEKMINGLR